MRLPLYGYTFRRQATSFVILFLERDGSTYLTSLLGRHPEITATFERFASMRQAGQGAQEQLAWARSFLMPPLVGRSKAIGFKTKLVDVMDPDGFRELLQSLDCRILHMGRRNHIKASISRINARRLHAAIGQWNLDSEEDRLPPILVDKAELDPLLMDRQVKEAELDAYVRQLGLPTLRLYYEDLLRDRESALNQVFSFLRVRPLSLDGRPIKNTSDDLREAIVNFHALRAAYRGTRYEPMFDERVEVPGRRPGNPPTISNNPPEVR